jgi:hypothetical protein
MLNSLSEAKTVKKINEWFRDAESRTNKWRKGATEDFDFYAGDQWSVADTAYLKENDRPIITFNRTAAIIDAVSGAERGNRQETKYLPRENSDDQVVETFSAAGKWIRDECDAEDEESDAFKDLCICGMGWTETFIDYQDEQDGKIWIERVSPLEMYWDHNAKKRNLSDARYVFRVKMVPRDSLKKYGKRLNLTGGANFIPNIVDQPHDREAARNYENESSQMHTDDVAVIQCQWWEEEPYVRLYNPEIQGEEELTTSEFQNLEAGGIVDSMKSDYGDQFSAVRQTRKMFYEAKVAGRTLLEKKELHPAGTNCPGFTFKAMTGLRDENKNVWYGLIRGMKDPQRWANKFFSLALEVIRAGAKGGIISEEGAFTDQRKAEREWARPDSITFVEDGALSGEKPRLIPKPTQGLPAGMDRMMNFAVESIRDVPGINVEMMGMAGRTQAGVVESSRIRQGMITLATLFDSLRRYRKEQGRVLLHFIRLYLPDQMMLRIVGEERFVQFRQDPTIRRFDVVVDQSPTSPNMKAEIWAGMQQVLPALLKSGLPIPPDIIDYIPIPYSAASKLKKFYASIQPTQEQQQRDEQSKALGIEQQAADIEETKSEAEKNLATAASNYAARELDKKRLTAETMLGAEENQNDKAKTLINAAKVIIEAMSEEGRERDRKPSSDSS